VSRITFGLAIDFGSTTSSIYERIADMTPIIDWAEEVGFERIWTGDGYPSAPVATHLPSPLILLGALAHRTGLGLGTGVSLLPAWSTLRLAYDAAMLDQITGGRLLLGVGAGTPALWRRFGVPAEGMADRLDETLAALRALWSGDDGYQGSLVQVEGAVWPRPALGSLPIWVGGRVRRSAERAARYGDGWYGGTHYRFEEVARMAAAYRDACVAVQKDPGAVSVNRITALAEREETAHRECDAALERLLGRYASRGDVRGLDSESGKPLVQALDDLLLVGTPDQVNRKLERYAAIGVTHVQARVAPEGLGNEQAERTVRLLGREVLPAWR
jgi:alkanesulfonate monooxygenase SsuD/methylene tetrahydromethanopterin reductase-like flavin-dependent oxidoreductase (luciferase family)